jgi:hypothetical protein
MALSATQRAEPDFERCAINVRGPRPSYREFSASNTNPDEKNSLAQGISPIARFD